jgi:hypothetical protein
MTGRDNDQKLSKSNHPGPTDYNVNYLVTLKKEPRVMIGNAKNIDNKSKEQAKSPGPDYYSPDRIKFKKRNRTIIFDQAKRDMLSTKGVVNTPGPGSYMIPCRFYDRPKFMMKRDNDFRFF